MKTAIIYCRVSSKKQEKEWESLENQEKACRVFCKNNNMQILWVYKEAFTWKNSIRPLFDEAINNWIINQINYFIIFDIDRFSREWYWVYTQIKNRLADNNIELRDSKNVIQKSNMIYSDDVVDMNQYKWNKNNSSKYAEVFLSTHAEEEGLKILQRTIPREIQLEKQGYKVRQSNFWYKNKKIEAWVWKKTIQIPDEIESKWIIDIFETKANWILTDKEIVDILNIKWYRSRNWKKLNIKTLNKYIEMPIYAWIVVWKWTWYKPVIAPYSWLVSIKLWNEANNWKFFIHKNWKDIIIENNPLRKKAQKTDEEILIFKWLVRYEDYAMRSYIKKWNVYYREWSKCTTRFNISQKLLIEKFEENISSYNLPDFLKEGLKDWFIPFFNNQQKSNEQNEKIIDKEIKKLIEENKNLVRKNWAWKISDELMEEMIKENNLETEDLKIQLSKIKQNKDFISLKVAELIKVLLDTETLWKSWKLDWKWKVLKMLVDELYFDDEKGLNIQENELYETVRLLKNVEWHPHSIESTNLWENVFVQNFFQKIQDDYNNLYNKCKFFLNE